MPVPAYLTINGAKQGFISEGAYTADSVGNGWQEGHENEILIQAFDMGVMQPRDPNHGQPVGRRRHQPASFTKIMDKASPLLWKALCAGEVLQLEMKFYRTSIEGEQEHYFTVQWTDAILVDGKGYIPNCLDARNDNYAHMEDWQFVYRKVVWTHERASTVQSDDWREGISS
jgi:type VI secretion system secreted protein Hcp